MYLLYPWYIFWCAYHVQIFIICANTSSSRASRWRKFQKKKELYSKEHVPIESFLMNRTKLASVEVMCFDEVVGSEVTCAELMWLFWCYVMWCYCMSCHLMSFEQLLRQLVSSTSAHTLRRCGLAAVLFRGDGSLLCCVPAISLEK